MFKTILASALALGFSSAVFAADTNSATAPAATEVPAAKTTEVQKSVETTTTDAKAHGHKALNKMKTEAKKKTTTTEESK